MKLNQLFFIIIGNFITSCFSNNFTVFNLLRRQLEFPMTRQNQFLVAKIPKGINWSDSFIFAGEYFVSKVKDVAVSKGVKEFDKENDLFFFNISLVEKTLFLEKEVEISKGTLVYSPWFRFIKEPFDFSGTQVNGKYLIKSLMYIARLNKIKVSNESSEDGVESLIFPDGYKGATRLDIISNTSIECLRLVSKQGSSLLDLKNYKVILFREHDEVLFEALMKTSSEVFKNMTLNKNNQTIELMRK